MTTEVYETGKLRWSIDEITEQEHKRESYKLMRLVKSGRPSDIGWVGLAKEIVSFNITRPARGEQVVVSVCESMDELPELLTDAEWDLKCEHPRKKFVPLTENDIDTIMEADEYAWVLGDVQTEVVRTQRCGSLPSLQEISDALMATWKETQQCLTDGFEECKRIVADYKAWKARESRKAKSNARPRPAAQ